MDDNKKKDLNPDILMAMISKDSEDILNETTGKLNSAIKDLSEKLNSVIKDLESVKNLQKHFKDELEETLFSLKICQDANQDSAAREKKLEKKNQELLFELLEANRIIKEDYRAKNTTATHLKTKGIDPAEKNAHLWELVSKIYHEAIVHWDSTYHFELACEDLKKEWLRTDSMSEDDSLDLWEKAKEIYFDQTEGI